MGIIIIRKPIDPAVTRALRTELRQRRARRTLLLKHQMELAGVSMTVLASRMQVSVSYISRITSGTRVPGLDTCIRMARELGITLQELADILVPPSVIRMVDDLPDPRMGTLHQRKAPRA